MIRNTHKHREAVRRITARYFTEHVQRIARTVPMYTDEALKVLGLPATASLDEAKRAYRALMMIHHPDRGGSHEKALQLNEAWAQLRDGVTITRPSWSRPQPSPPPRPTKAPYTPTPGYRSQPQPPPSSSKPHVKMTWQRAEYLTGGRSNPESKDHKRVADMIMRAKGSPAKLMALAQQMANSIDSVDKALRRGRACEESSDPSVVPASQFFYNRAQVLAGLTPQS